jgi:lysophospholipase
MRAQDVHGYLGFMRDEVMPFFERQEKLRFLGRAGVSLSGIHVRPDAARRTPHSCTLVFVPGRTESYLKYAETFYDLAAHGHEIFAFDHRGQGFSERLLADPQVGYVADFDDYLGDFETFLATVVASKRSFSRSFVVAHSMGGAIVLGTLLGMGDGPRQPGANEFLDGLCGLALSAPMLAIRLGFGEWLTQAVVSTRCLLGQAKDFATQPGPIDVARYGNDLTHSIPRLTWYRATLADRPEIQLGLPSNQWMLEAIRYTALLRKRLKQKPLALPLLVLSPGRDSVVDTEAQTLIRQSYGGRLLERIALPDAAHDPFLETDEIRAIVLSSLQQFVAVSEDLAAASNPG